MNGIRSTCGTGEFILEINHDPASHLPNLREAGFHFGFSLFSF